MTPTSLKTFGKYLLVQSAGWALAALALAGLRYWLDLPLWVVTGLFGLWLAKDLAMYPLVRRAYEPSEARTGAAALIGARGTAREGLDPAGYVHVRGELWRAETPPGGPPIPPGSRVAVRAARGLTLIVEPEEPPGVRAVEQGGASEKERAGTPGGLTPAPGAGMIVVRGGARRRPPAS